MYTDGVSLIDHSTNIEFLVYKQDVLVHFIVSLTSQAYRLATVHSGAHEHNKMWAHCNVYKLTPQNATLYNLPANSKTNDSFLMKFMVIY